ncbi:MAG: hypothetical protein PHD97_11800 [Bacteroidales bacterium]|nr:hypothetical protein [Bacteroidales bacterium]
MLPELKGKGLFVFSDPGGAKPVLAFIKLKNIQDYLIITDRNYDFFSDYGLKIKTYQVNDETEVFNSYKPDFIFTGTSYTSKIELKFLREAGKRKIASFSFIDHYTRYKDRFECDSEYIYPDTIFLTDEKAKKIAIKEGLNKFSEILITGNFHHQFLSEWKPSTEKKFLLGNNTADENKKIVVFAPDPLSNIGGKEKFLYDETDVWKIISDSFAGQLNYLNIHLVIKLHPNQNKEYFKNFVVQSAYPQVIYADDINTNTLIYYSDIVIGMFSGFLIEAKCFCKTIIRCLPNNKLNDPLAKMGIGSVCKDKESFVSLIKKAVI